MVPPPGYDPGSNVLQTFVITISTKVAGGGRMRIELIPWVPQTQVQATTPTTPYAWYLVKELNFRICHVKAAFYH